MFFSLGSRSFNYIYVDTPVFKNYLMYIIVALNILTPYCHFFVIPSVVNLVMGSLKFF